MIFKCKWIVLDVFLPFFQWIHLKLNLNERIYFGLNLIDPRLCESRLIFKDILCPHARLGKNCVEMALKEFHEIKKIKKSGIDLFLNEYSQKRMDKSLVFVWAHNDRWADEWIRNNILDFLNPWIHGIEWIVSKKLKHSLIIRAPSEDIEGYFSRLLIKSIQKKLK